MEYVLNIIGVPENSLKRLASPLVIFSAHICDHFIPSRRNNYHPHFLGHRALALLSALLVAVKVSAIALIAVGPVAPAFSSAITVDNIISLTNESRQQYGLGALHENQLLDRAAQAKADDMLAKGYFSHNTPDGRTPWSFILAAGYNYLQAGENLAVNFTEAENVETAWMNSPGHKANILNSNFLDIGIGVSQGVYQGHESIFVVQEFGTPAEQQIILSDTPTKVQTSAVPAPAKPLAKIVPGQEPSAQPASVLPATTQTEPVNIASGDVNLKANDVEINAQVNGPAVKVIAYFGQLAIMLNPKGDGLWQGQVSIGQLAQSNSTVRLKAFDISGSSDQMQLADFSASTMQNYNLAGTTPTNYLSLWGHQFNLGLLQNRFYLLLIAALLTSLVLAIAIKKRIQHLPLIANASFVVILAVMMFWTG